MSELRRKVEILREGTWVTATIRDLKIGDTFRMYEPDDGLPGSGEPVLTNSGRHETVATSDPFLKKWEEDGQEHWTIEAED